MTIYVYQTTITVRVDMPDGLREDDAGSLVTWEPGEHEACAYELAQLALPLPFTHYKDEFVETDVSELQLVRVEEEQ